MSNNNEDRQEENRTEHDEDIPDPRHIADDPVEFAKFFLRMDPFPYQAGFLKDPSKRIVVCAGRQVGKSFIASARAVWFAVSHDNTVTLIVSATLRQSMLMFQTIMKHVELSPLVLGSVRTHTRTRILFTNGSQIIALPCGRFGYGLRGYTADLVIMDEASFMPPEVITEVILPMLSTTNGAAIMLSTPWSKDGIFYKAFTSPQWSKYKFPSSANPKISPEFLEEQRSLVGEQQFAQEYLGEFVDDQKAYFPQNLLRDCLHACEVATTCEYCNTLSKLKSLASAVQNSNLMLRGTLFGGYDPGGKQDPAAFVIVERLGEGNERTFRVIFTQSYLSQLRGKKVEDDNLYTRMTSEISDWHRKLHFQKIATDETGLGKPILEHMKALSLPVEGFNLSLRVKEEILSRLKILLEQKRIILPPDNLELLSNLNCIESERTASGGYLFSHPNGTHDDLAYALALAVAVAATSNKGKVLMMKY